MDPICETQTGGNERRQTPPACGLQLAPIWYTCGFPPGGYYLLPKGEALFSPCIDLPAKFPNQSLDLSQVWNEAVLAYNEKIDAIGSGVVHAEGIPEDPGNPLTNAHGNGPAPGLKQTGFRLDTPCNFCDYTNLCGKTEG